MSKPVAWEWTNEDVSRIEKQAEDRGRDAGRAKRDAEWLAAVDRWMRDAMMEIVNDEKDPLIVVSGIKDKLKTIMQKEV